MLDIQILSTTISGFAFGLVLLLSLSCFRFVYQRLRQDSEPTSKRMNRILLGYTVFAASLSMLSLIGEIMFVRNIVFAHPRPPSQQYDMLLIFNDIRLLKLILDPSYGVSMVTLPLAIWSADGFMVRLYNFLSS